MDAKRAVGVLLVIIGIVALVWGGVFWTDRDTVVDAGPIEIATENREGFAIGAGRCSPCALRRRHTDCRSSTAGYGDGRLSAQAPWLPVIRAYSVDRWRVIRAVGARGATRKERSDDPRMSQVP
jgi:hypothetical protein